MTGRRRLVAARAGVVTVALLALVSLASIGLLLLPSPLLLGATYGLGQRADQQPE